MSRERKSNTERKRTAIDQISELKRYFLVKRDWPYWSKLCPNQTTDFGFDSQQFFASNYNLY